MINRALFTSVDQNWRTPSKVYEDLNSEFHFTFDPCPPNPTFNGLEVEWGTSNFVNPPYKQVKDWLKKGYEEWQKGKTVVFLIPSRTDTKYWHRYVMQSTEIRFIKGRLKFGDAKNSAPFPSAIVVFKGDKNEKI